MKSSYLLSKDVAKRMTLVHPPEPRKELLISSFDQGVYVGRTRFLGTPVFWDPQKLINPHVAVMGITGAGKSYTVKTFLTRASLIWNSNGIILDWVGEYNSWVKQAGGIVINIAKEKLNILDLVGLPKESRIKQIMSALEILADLKNMPNEKDEIEETIEQIYESKEEKEKNLKEVVRILEEKGRKKAARAIKKFTVEGSDFFSGKTTLDIRKLTNSGLVCIDLHELPSEEIRSLVGLTILQYIKEIMRIDGISEEEKRIKLFVVLDEAWKIAQDERSDVITIVREGRKYGFSLIVATQNPTDMHKTIFSNIGTVFVLRLVLREFRDYVRNSIGYSDFIDQEIGRFGVGDAAVNMIFSKRVGKTPTFLLEKIDGEEPIIKYMILGDKVEFEVEREQLVRMLYELGLNEGQVTIVKNELTKNDGQIEAENLVALLEKFGFAKSSIISFLRGIGVDEKSMIRVFSLLKMRRASKGVVNLVLDNE